VSYVISMVLCIMIVGIVSEVAQHPEQADAGEDAEVDAASE